MNKIIAITLALMVLATGGIGGLVYAQSGEHEPILGHKLVGAGVYGVTTGEEGSHRSTSIFTLTNPDCVSSIDLEQISLFDQDGNILYEGQLLLPEGGVLTMLNPHETYVATFSLYLGASPSPGIAVSMEIFWSWSQEEGLPLIGQRRIIFYDIDASGNIIVSRGFEVSLVHLEQELKAKHKD